ncbi:hypothetical protein CC80DRAFT_433349 [Byssothecium circinans]|uniref:Uncharacterized protein n=1 Tax=Byssothecium circinans TaxID=147558 RepID=A0A6A5UFC1_9PLEO|nr:hypothetical protein CC80DRAFT_433349 [Byssothecium circinans]
MENVTSDSNKILAEKLALNRELSSLRPEVEHLRAQVDSNAGLLTEKLALQRQLNTAQVELENEKRTAARAVAKQGKKMEQDDELRAEVEELRKEMAKEKKDRLKVEATLAKTEKAVEKAHADFETQQQATERVQAKLDKISKKEADRATKRGEERDTEIEQLREELAQEKAARIKADKANKKGSERDAELDELRAELENEKSQRLKLEKVSKKGTPQNEAQPDELRKELDQEKRERKKQEKEYSKTLAELQGRNTVLDDKLNAFREKLRSTKDKLKEKEAALERAERAQTAPPAKAAREREGSMKPATHIRKRMAASVEPETNLGTPGNGFPAKKAKHAVSSGFGDTSTFSLTPFLNRTGSVAPGETIIEEEEEEEGASGAAQEPTPTTPPKKAPNKAAEHKSKPKALAPSASNKANAKPRKKAAAPILEMVTEEVSQLSSQSKDNSENAPITIPLKDADEGGPSLKPTFKSLKAKPRKSLMSFATFTEEPAAEKKKKRKLGSSSTGGGLGKTLFDAEEEDDAPTKPTSSKGIFAARALGKSVLGKGRAQQGPISGGHNMLSEEGFSFSPLKKDRRGASILK